MVRSSRVVRCAWKIRCGREVGLMQQSLTSENPVGQVPGLMPMETGVSLGLAGGRGRCLVFPWE